MQNLFNLSKDEQNLFWNKQIKQYRSQYSKEIKKNNALNCFMPYWETIMLKDNKAISDTGVINNWIKVYKNEKEEELIYSGEDKKHANRIKSENPKTVIKYVPMVYSNYVSYEERKSQALQFESQINNQLI